jgi:hypothetical protein
MKASAILAFLSIGFASPAFAADASAEASPPAESETGAPGPIHYDFEDDQVEGDIQRPDGELISSIQQARHESLIEIRRYFMPEILKMIEDL